MKKNLKLPTVNQLRKIPSFLSGKEKILIAFFSLILIGLSFWKVMEFSFQNTKISPTKGGVYSEGMIGLPRHINPVISQINEVDETISSLIYSSLFKFDINGELVNDLADSYQISDDKKTYQIAIKKDVKWHDGTPFTAEDIVYTASVIKNPDYESLLMPNLGGIAFEKVDDYHLEIKTKVPFGQTLSVLTFGILPKHIWESINPENFSEAQYNLKPLGSGPYIFDEFRKEEGGKILSYQLKANANYYGKKVFIETVNFKFYSSEEELINAYNTEEILAAGGLPSEKLSLLNQDLGKIYQINIPSYFAVFFNQTKSKVLSDKIVRTALAYSIDKESLIKEVFGGFARPIEGPYPPFLKGYNPNTKIYDFALKHANNILENQGWKDTDGDKIREKDGGKLEFRLITSDDPETVKAANIIKESWAKAGANVEIKAFPIAGELTQNYIKPRDYEAIFLGEVLSLDPNPFVFWHSSERKDPGLNLALYSNKEADKILEEAETLTDEDARAEKYKQFQFLVIDDVPAVFLYSPFYLYAINDKIKGTETNVLFSSSNRLENINGWYMKTERVWK